MHWRDNLVVDNFQKSVNDLIEKRIEDITNSEEYKLFMEGIYQDLEQNLSSSMTEQNEKEKDNIIDDIKSNIFQKAFLKSKLTYRVAFKDALSFFINTLLLPKK